MTEFAAGLGVKTMIENHGYFMQDSDRVKKLIEAVNHKNFGWLTDMGNFLCADEDPVHAMQTGAKMAVHAHAKDFHYKKPGEFLPKQGWVGTRGGNHLRGAGAVVDKDFTAELLAEELGADCLMILTAVEKVAVHFGKPNQRWLTHMTVPVAEKYIAEGQFAPGSMLPKVEAAVAFAKSSPGRQTLITQLEKALDGMRGQTGTIIG